MLAELQPQLQFALHLGHLHNVDLFARGYYQIRCALRGPKTQLVKCDVHVLRSAASQLFPASVIDGCAVSTTAEVMYAHESLALDDHINFTLTVLQRADKLPKWLDFSLQLELWFVEKDRFTRPTNGAGDASLNADSSANIFAGFRCVSRRQLQLSVALARGLHYHRPVLFDFYHLAALSLTLHVSLIGLVTKGSRSLSEMNAALNRSRSQLWNSGNMNSAPQPPALPDNGKLSTYHRGCCRLLLDAYESLQRRIHKWSHLLQVPVRIRWSHCLTQLVDTEIKLDALCRRLQESDGDGSDPWQLFEQDQVLLSQELAVLWTQFIELFRGVEAVEELLANEHHAQRVKRFGEAFFHSEDTMQCLLARSYTGNCHSFSQSARIVDVLRRSHYLNSVSRLAVACDDTDGTGDSFPVIFEEKYCSSAARSLRSVSSETDEQPLSRSNSSKDRRMKRLKETFCLDLTHTTGICSHVDGERSDPSSGDQVVTVDEHTKTCVTNGPPKESSQSSSVDEESAVHEDYGVYDVYASGSSHSHASLARASTEPNLSSQQVVSDAAYFVEAVLNRSSSEADLNGVHTMLSEAVVPLERRPSDVETNTDSTSSTNAPTNGSQEKSIWKRILAPKVPVRKKRKAKLEAERIKNGITGSENNGTASLEQQAAEDEGVGTLSEASSSFASAQRQPPHVDAFLVDFVRNKESFKEKMSNLGYVGHLYSDLQCLGSSRAPYLWHRCHRTSPSTIVSRTRSSESQRSSGTPSPEPPPHRLHLIVCVHGLDGSKDDLRPYQTFLRLCYAADCANVEFLMSESNQEQTFAGFESMSSNLVSEILRHLAKHPSQPHRISFISHSMGALIVRAACASERLSHIRERFYTCLTLNAPHCGLLYTHKTASLGLSVMQWWKKSLSLDQLSIRDQPVDSLRKSFLYELSKNNALSYFRHVLVVGSAQDLYVPCHSALIQPCKAAQKDNTEYGVIYGEMVNNMLSSIGASERHTTFVRYTAFHGFSGVSRTHQVLGRAAHVAVLDDDVFVEKLLCVSAMQYFK